MFEAIQWLIYLVFFVAMGLNIYVIKTLGEGVLKILFVSFGFSMFFVGVGMLFGIFQDAGIFALSDVTFHVWWHFILYLSLLSIIWGGHRIKSIAGSKDQSTDKSKDALVFGSMLLVALAVFVFAPALENSMTKTLTGSFVDTWGLHHMLVFVGAGISGWYLLKIKGQWGILGTSITLMTGFLFFVGGQHFWETINESWRLTGLDEEIVEGVELLFLLPALILFSVAQWKVLKFFKAK